MPDLGPYRYIGFGGRPPRRTRPNPFIGVDLASGKDRTVVCHRDPLKRHDWIIIDDVPDLKRYERWRRWNRFKAWLRRPWRIPPKYAGLSGGHISVVNFPVRPECPPK